MLFNQITRFFLYLDNEDILGHIKRNQANSFGAGSCCKNLSLWVSSRGSAGKDSDWDILILLNKTNITLEIEKSITYPLYDLEFDTGEIISPMVYSISEWINKYSVTPFYHNVMQEGKLI